MAKALEHLYYDLIQRLKQQNHSLKLLAAGLTILCSITLLILAVKIKPKR